MVPSSILCRAQETLNRTRAAETLLANVKLVATHAAAAWAREAEAAESREARQMRARAITAAAAEASALAFTDLMHSENPDRGLGTVKAS